MINVIDKQNSFLIQWVQKLFCNHSSVYTYIPNFYYDKLGMDLSIFKSNVKVKCFKGLENIQSVFWHKVLCAWLASQPTYGCDQVSESEVLNQVIWNNEIIKFKGGVLMWKKWIKSGFIYLGDLFVDGEYITLDRAANAIEQPPGQLMFEYYALYNALPITWRVQQEAWVDFNPVEPVFNDRSVLHLSSGSTRNKLL